MKWKKAIMIVWGITLCMATPAFAVRPPTLTAKGVAIYGWKDGVMTPILVKNQHRLYTIASLTKLVTAKTVEDLYRPDDVITISKAAAATEGTIPGIVAGAQFTRNDLLKALLVNSSNDAAMAFMESAGSKTFLSKMNTILHTNNYTATSFTNPSGLDPTKRMVSNSNRMTPYHLTVLFNDIYAHDPLLRKIMDSDNIEIRDIKNDTPVVLHQTNALFRDDSYKGKVLMSKTGLTDLAGQNSAFVTPGIEGYDYVTVVILGSQSRTADSKKILDWLDATNEAQHYGG